MKAITATARKVSVIVYKMLTNKEPFQYDKLEQNIEKLRIQQIRRIKQSMAKLEISLQDLDNEEFLCN